jgi:hypothetical protein
LCGPDQPLLSIDTFPVSRPLRTLLSIALRAVRLMSEGPVVATPPADRAGTVRRRVSWSSDHLPLPRVYIATL